jgi:peptidoglycan/LPS O-acetylase OafA/YrhL
VTAVAIEEPVTQTVAIESRERLGYIDGLRALAAISVVFCHTEMSIPIKGSHFLLDGGHGVDLFFILSGFCLSYPTIRKLHASGALSFDVARFAVHRIVRIGPPYYLATLLLLAIAALSLLHGGPFAPPGTNPLHLGDVVGQLFLLDHGISLASPPYWTLLLEMRWYLVFPVFLLLWVRQPRIFVLVIVLVYIAFFGTRARSEDLGALPAFMLGIIAADIAIRRPLVLRNAPWLILVALAGALVLEPFMTNPDEFGIEHRQLIYQTNPGWHLAAFFTVIAVARSRWARNSISFPLLTFLGVASYSIYLMHYPIVSALAPHLPQNVVGFMITVVVAVAGGVLFYLAAEQWFCGGPVRARLYALLETPVRAMGAWLTRRA